MTAASETAPPRPAGAGALRRVTTAAAVAVVALAALVAPARAQTVRGTLVTYPEGAPVPGGGVALLDSAGVAVDSARASAEGKFTLRAPAAGSYTLYFTQAGYASVPSSGIRLVAGEVVEHEFSVPLISGAAIRRMAEVIDVEQRLQSDLRELCGEEPRPESAGMLIGVVRRRPGGEPLSGAIVRVEARPAGAEPFRKATVTSANGVYVICNVPPGIATTRTELVGYRADEGPVTVRLGEFAWYDVFLRRR